MTKRDYASKSLPYPLEPGETPAWERLVSTLYSPEERHKIEWCIGAIVTGESKKLQKFLVFYGEMCIRDRFHSDAGAARSPGCCGGAPGFAGGVLRDLPEAPHL